jgi:hypothetical protein
MSTVEMSVFEMHVVKMPVFVISMADMSLLVRHVVEVSSVEMVKT